MKRKFLKKANKYEKWIFILELWKAFRGL
jgi:hypothetical protein